MDWKKKEKKRKLKQQQRNTTIKKKNKVFFSRQEKNEMFLIVCFSVGTTTLSTTTLSSMTLCKKVKRGVTVKLHSLPPLFTSLFSVSLSWVLSRGNVVAPFCLLTRWKQVAIEKETLLASEENVGTKNDDAVTQISGLSVKIVIKRCFLV